jgi:hypothetical protein
MNEKFWDEPPKPVKGEGPHPYDNWIRDWERAGKDGDVETYVAMEKALDRWIADLIIEPLTHPISEAERGKAFRDRRKEYWRLSKKDRHYKLKSYYHGLYKGPPYGTIRHREGYIEPLPPELWRLKSRLEKGPTGRVIITERWNTKEWITLHVKEAAMPPRLDGSHPAKDD